MKIIFGSRGSDLALTQTRLVISQLLEVRGDVTAELRVIKTKGDNKPDAPLAEIGGLGAFTREIEVALLNREIDVAIHSLKDLPTKQPDDLTVAAVTERECPTDALISPEGHRLDSLPHGALVGTSSLRRKAQLLAARPDLQIRELRGNVPTRMRRAAPGDLDAVMLASAGLIRLQLFTDPRIQEIPLSQMLPAPGQGALALETRADNYDVVALLTALHNATTAVAVMCERAVLQAFGGGCRAPLGVYVQVQDERVYLQAFAANMDTGITARVSCDAPLNDASALGVDTGAALRRQINAPSSSDLKAPLPLQNRRIVVTRAPHQATSFGAMLEESGASVLYLPLIEISPCPDAPLPTKDEGFDWLVFTSVNAVRYFHDALSHVNRSLSDYHEQRIAAIGEATAAKIRNAGLHIDVVPMEHTSEALVEKLLQTELHPAGKRVLLPQSSLARSVIADQLAARGMLVHAIPIYNTVQRNLTERDVADLIAFAPDCIAFFSPSAACTYIASGLYETLRLQNDNIMHASIGPVTTEALRNGNCCPLVESPKQNEAVLCKVIVKALQ